MNESSKLALLGSNARPTLISYDGLQSRCAMRLGATVSSAVSLRPGIRSERCISVSSTSPCPRPSLAASTGHEAKHDRHRNIQQKFA